MKLTICLIIVALSLPSVAHAGAPTLGGAPLVYTIPRGYVKLDRQLFPTLYQMGEQQIPISICDAVLIRKSDLSVHLYDKNEAIPNYYIAISHREAAADTRIANFLFKNIKSFLKTSFSNPSGNAQTNISMLVSESDKHITYKTRISSENAGGSASYELRLTTLHLLTGQIAYVVNAQIVPANMINEQNSASQENAFLKQAQSLQRTINLVERTNPRHGYRGMDEQTALVVSSIVWIFALSYCVIRFFSTRAGIVWIGLLVAGTLLYIYSALLGSQANEPLLSVVLTYIISITPGMIYFIPRFRKKLKSND